MNLCPRQRCPHYGRATKYPRKCYYEPQCWRGQVDAMLSLIRLRIRGLGMNHATAIHAVCTILFINTVVDFYAWLSLSPSVIAWGMTVVNMMTLLVTLAIARGKL
jgi:hypothetical protein